MLRLLTHRLAIDWFSHLLDPVDLENMYETEYTWYIMEGFYFCYAFCSCINNEVNSKSPGRKLAVSICQTTHSTYWESAIILRSGKSINNIKNYIQFWFLNQFLNWGMWAFDHLAFVCVWCKSLISYLGDRERWLSEFEVSLVYRVKYRTARATQRKPILKNKAKQQQQPKKKKKLQFSICKMGTQSL